MQNEIRTLLPEAAAAAEAQGWDDQTLLTLTARFITEQGLEARFTEYAQALADEENAESNEDLAESAP